MKVALDTSVLVAAVVETHPHHGPAFRWLSAASRKKVSATAALHAWAETWGVLTRLPSPEPLTPAVADAILARIFTVVEPQLPTLATYQRAGAVCAAAGLRSGAVYDALHVAGAEDAGADLLLTFNVKDFARLRTTVAIASPIDRSPGE